ncbi:chaperone NapD [Campylobacter peloridis]|uniref:chaperone NapD n=1 Tax=Campylobacter peloridis TaxID=488546 RepID=UPI001C739B70|nr:chaperone NapD [Campylobacter peloridis]MBX1886426.1 chaperone NapD [Campylobacter peloridis]MBX2078580.1 chaperone NapD [Campylobacter peloridis]
MNLSSVLILTTEEKIEKLKEQIQKVPYCTIELVQDEKIIVVIESKNLDDELKAYKQLEQLDGVVSINMVFSYQDLDGEREKILKANLEINSFDEKLNNNDLEYYGNIYRKY